jgi:hypothetical protein
LIFFVLDVDPRNGGQVPEGLPDTVQAATPSGGRHFLFKMAPGIANSAGKLGPGLDIRGIGGQILVYPSKTNAGAYRWVRAPWDVAIADAPEWLLQQVQRSTVPSQILSAANPQNTWPPASSDVIAAARAALDKHGPAIQGKGGDLHTFRAAALLVHDFALTDEEAWPLLVEWNSECEPPWDEPGLRAKLRGGSKYGTRDYGCARPFNALEAANKALAEWDGDQNKLRGVAERILECLDRCDNPTEYTVILRNLAQLTGLKAKDIQATGFRVKLVLNPGEIMVSTDLHRMADDSDAAIAPHVFQRAGVLCEVVTGKQTFIHDLDSSRIQDLMSSSATYVRNDDKKGAMSVLAPPAVAAVLQSRRSHPSRVIDAVTTAPIFLADGSILSERGYNEQARVFLEPSVTVNVPDAPTQTDARAAVAVFADLLCDYQLAGPEDFSSWLAGLLTPLVKASICNAPAPLFCVSASSPGAGKTLLTDVIARIVIGGAAEIRPYNPKDPSEWGKRLTAFVKAGSPVSVFDNVNGSIGDEGLDRLVTSATWSDRLLGASEAPPMANVTTWFATGNNIEPVGDTVRRVLMVRVVVDVEKPQERTGFKRPLLAEYAQEHRADLLGHALTILRAYHLAGRPDQRLPAWGSFTTWSALVRGALVWAGCADPFLTQQRANRDTGEPDNEVHDFWIGVVGDSDGTPNGICTTANQRDAMSVLGAREPLNPHNLRRFLNRFVDKPRGGRRIVKAGPGYRVASV